MAGAISTTLAAARKCCRLLLVVRLVAATIEQRPRGLIRSEQRATGLKSALEGIIRRDPAQQIFEIEASIRPAYEAFPKNAMGRIPTREIFPGIVRSFFAKEHGWLIKGLEPPSVKMRAAQVHEAAVLESAPALLKALKEEEAGMHPGGGMSLSDIVRTIVALEHLLLDQSLPLLHGAYALNNFSEAKRLAEAEVHEVLRSYMLLFRSGDVVNVTDVVGHSKMKAWAQDSPEWPSLKAFEGGVVRDAAPPETEFAFHDVSDMARLMARRFGKWQNAECVDMKDTLMSLSKNESLGRVALETFRGEPAHDNYQFTETDEDLKRVGALEEAADGNKSVLIANYLLSPSNCIASSKYFSVCCLNECEVLRSELEVRIQDTVSSPDALLAMVVALVPASSSLQSRTQGESSALTAQLYAIAERHDGAVPLHSADFQRWLHDALPNECPKPSAADSAAEESEMAAAAEWLHELPQKCSRVTRWQAAMHEELEVKSEGDVLLNV